MFSAVGRLVDYWRQGLLPQVQSRLVQKIRGYTDAVAETPRRPVGSQNCHGQLLRIRCKYT